MHPTSFPKKKSEKQDKLKETTKRLIEKREELKASVNDNDEKKQEFEEINRRTKKGNQERHQGTQHRIDQ